MSAVTQHNCSCNGTMKHEAMPDQASYDSTLPKSFYSDSVISGTPHDLVCFMIWLHYLIDIANNTVYTIVLLS